MNKYEPIPIPRKQKLRELRVKVLPIIVFVVSGLIIASLWNSQVSTPGMIGEVVSDSSNVVSPDDGTLINFFYEPYDYVESGQLLGQIYRSDSLLVNAMINEVRAEIELISESLDLTSGEQRTRMDLEGLKIDEINTRISLAETELTRSRVRSEFNRVSELRERDLISEQEYEMIETELELLNVQVREYEDLISYLNERIEELEEFTGYHTRGDRDPVMAAIKIQEQRIQSILAEYAPIPLYASLSGVISRVNFISGDFVQMGDEILKIESQEPNYIVGYLRQPFTVDPVPGLEVEVRTRRAGRAFFNSTIQEVGGHIRLVEPHLQRPGAIFETGLPVRISVANRGDINLNPGEIVDIVVKR
tara:strand:- start:17439 stop:18524 length:1086 start_codon:yes stop_codon:yes gene_type:complete